MTKVVRLLQTYKLLEAHGNKTDQFVPIQSFCLDLFQNVNLFFERGWGYTANYFKLAIKI